MAHANDDVGLAPLKRAWSGELQDTLPHRPGSRRLELEDEPLVARPSSMAQIASPQLALDAPSDLSHDTDGGR